ncbi:MAG: hypothetical protein K1Y36_19760 [Blastocatellia bacterium]|nr:hypothetical protein [Blastocatellia bacterium]
MPPKVSTDRKLLVRHEGLAQRCEICHQIDLFEPVSGICRRCPPSRIPPPQVLDPQSPAFSQRVRRILGHELMPNERVLWVGTPSWWYIPSQTIGSFVVSTLIVGLIGFGCIVNHLVWLGILLWALIGGAFLDGLNRCLNRPVYLVSDRRVLIVTQRLFQTNSLSYFGSQLQRVTHIRHSGQRSSLIFDHHPIQPQAEIKANGIGFKSIPQAETVEQLIRTYVLPPTSPLGFKERNEDASQIRLSDSE